MRLPELVATALPQGNRIELSWLPSGAVTTGVRVVRRTVAYPEGPEPAVASGGVVVADSSAREIARQPDGRFRVLDGDLRDGTVYYYQVFPYRMLDGGRREYDADLANRASAAATGPYQLGELMYQRLPGVYRRFDTAGQLRDFLAIIGAQLDQIYSDVRALADVVDISRVDGRLLPLLAEWIGWPIDRGHGLDRQRAELRNAAALYGSRQTLGAAQAAVRRVTGLDCVIKEFVDNVAMTNRPERLNLWLDRPGLPPADLPLCFDDTTAGRLAVSTTADHVRVYYDTSSSGQREIREKVYAAGEWQPSEPVVARRSVDREPAVVTRGDEVWLFWATSRPGLGWRIEFRHRSPGTDWSPIASFTTGADDRTQRRSPAVALDDDDRLWLFWRELTDKGWRLRYQRFTHPFGPTPAGAKTFPDVQGSDPRVETDVSVLFRPGGAGPHLWLLWARRSRLDPQQRVWRVASRLKSSTNADTLDDWSKVVELPAAAPSGHHDREPAPFVGRDGKLSAYFSSTRDGSWSVWRAGMNSANHTWETPVQVTTSPYTDRAPVAFRLDDDEEPSVAYRSAQPVTFRSERSSSVVTSDSRYCGSTTVRASNGRQVARLGEPDDFSSYTFDAGPPGGRTDRDLIAPDTVGIYVDVSGGGAAALEASGGLLATALSEFLPTTIRAVVIPTENG